MDPDSEMLEPLGADMGAAAAAMESYREQQLAQQHDFGGQREE